MCYIQTRMLYHKLSVLLWSALYLNNISLLAPKPLWMILHCETCHVARLSKPVAVFLPCSAASKLSIHPCCLFCPGVIVERWLLCCLNIDLKTFIWLCLIHKEFTNHVLCLPYMMLAWIIYWEALSGNLFFHQNDLHYFKWSAVIWTATIIQMKEYRGWILVLLNTS